MKPARWKVILAAFGLFSAGLVAGGLVTAKVGTHLVRRAWLAPAAAHGAVDRAAERIQKNLTNELKLDDAQAASVHTELIRTAEDLKSLRVETVKKAKADLVDGIRRIAATLPPDKRIAFYRLVRERFSHLGVQAAPDAAPQP